MSIGHTYNLFGEVSIQGLLTIFKLDLLLFCGGGVEFCKFFINLGY